jgi:tetratricopeptide (TPR) repeat protein
VPLLYHPSFLLSAGHLACMYDPADGAPLFLRARDTARDLGDRLQMALALAMLSYAMFRDSSAAMVLVEESLAVFRELSYQPGIAQTLTIIGEIARCCGDDDHARRVYEEALALSRQTGEIRRIAIIYSNLAFIALHEGKAERARELERESLRLARAMNNQLEMAKAPATLAGALGALGQPKLAARLFGASERALERLGAFHLPADKWEIDGMISAVRAQLDEATFQAAWEEGRELTLAQAVAQALDECDIPISGNL